MSQEQLNFEASVEQFRKAILNFTTAVQQIDDSLAAFMATTEVQIDRLEAAAGKFDVALQQLSAIERSRLPQQRDDNSRFVRAGIVRERGIATPEVGSGGDETVGPHVLLDQTESQVNASSGKSDLVADGKESLRTSDGDVPTA